MSKEHLIQTGCLAFAGWLAFNAFSRSSREKIWERAGGVSEISGFSHEALECAHVNHDRDSGYYDDPDNGMLVTPWEHLHEPPVGHMLYKGEAVDQNGLLPNGLSPQHNNFAIRALEGRITDRDRSQEKIRQSSFSDLLGSLFGD